MTTSENKSKRYFWNSNAETHANAVFALTVLSVGVAGIVSMLAAGAAIWLTDASGVDAFLAVLAMGVVFLVTWLVMFVVAMGYYSRLIESQVINPPTDKVIHEKRVYYQTGNGDFKKFK